MMLFFLLLIAAYIIGSVNFSIAVLKAAGKKDPRRRFSKNAGATNVYRLEGPFWAAMVLVLDMARALGTAYMAVYLLPFDLVPWIGLGLIAGNRFPVFHGFKGGKGVANYLGFTLMMSPVFSALGIVAWGIAFRIWRMPFISSFALVGFLALGTIVSQKGNAVGIFGVLCTVGFIVWCHHANIIGWMQRSGR